jgi:hypothetical protein
VTCQDNSLLLSSLWLNVSFAGKWVVEGGTQECERMTS